MDDATCPAPAAMPLFQLDPGTPPHVGRNGDEASLFGIDPRPDRIRSVATERVLWTWGRTSNQSGAKPPTHRRVRREVVEEIVERWCGGCNTYLPLDSFGRGKYWCFACRRRQDEGYTTPERRERMKWRAHSQRARRLGIEDAISFDQWVAVVERHGGRCAAPGCDGPYEKMDHIVSHAAGGPHRAENLQPLCTAHHREKTRAEQSASAADIWAGKAEDVA